VTDLRDRLADFEAAAHRLLGRRPDLQLVWARPATCHPNRPLRAQTLGDSCYTIAWAAGTLPEKRSHRRQIDFIADYELLRSEGYTRRQIAERLGTTYDAVGVAYRRAVRAGLLTPDRRTA
jgi:CRP-like cAMP-binding protein